LSYALHIERAGNPIEMEEWVAAVESIPSACLGTPTAGANNPKTDEIFEIVGRYGDVSVRFENNGFLGFGKKSHWVPCFSLYSGKASFRSPDNMHDAKKPVRQVAKKLAELLNAQIVGDDGEIYDW